MKTECIGFETLSKYIFKRLSPKDRELAENHFAECDACFEKLNMNMVLFKEMDLTQFAPAPGSITKPFFEKIPHSINKTFIPWIKDLIAPDWLGVPATVRGGDDLNNQAPSPGILVKKEMQGLQTEIYFKRQDENRATIWIQVTENKESAPDIYLFLKQENGPSAARLLNRKHEGFQRIPYGRYTLKLEQQEVSKGSYSFDIDDQGIHEQ